MWDRLQRWVRHYEKPLIIFLGALSLTSVLLSLDFHFFEANLYDLRMSRGLQSRANRDIVLITIDDFTSKEVDEFAPLSIDYHTQFLETLELLEPRAIGYLVDLNHVKQVNPEVYEKGWSDRFLKSIDRLQARGTLFLFGTPFDVTGEVPPPPPFDALSHAVAVIHKDGNVFAEDKITRRSLLSLSHKPSFHLEFAQRLGALGKDAFPRGSFYVPQVDGYYFFFRYHDTTVLCKKWPCELPYPRYSFSDVIHHRVSADQIKDKIVLVGSLSLDDSSDFVLTPYSKALFTNPKILVHANILDSILQNDGIIRVPDFINAVVTFALTAIVLWWIMTSTPLYGVVATLCLALVFILVSQFLFQVKGLWLRESQPLVGIFVGYYLAVPYRLIREYKKRWEYQRKHELLTQVEELKTNFLSLVTHDLKTPVARIQGLAEVLMRKSAAHLLDSDRQTLQHILAATEELNHFITQLLELNKIESNRLHLVKESKDINQLIEKSIENFKDVARARKIQLVPNLEPLFPIKLDASLISKVLNNLIDNAIKYSPSGSEVRIESREEKNWVLIQVEDRGIGMTREETQNLFTRFYRAKNDTTTSIPGTGLGLYLTKYFIEAHQGQVHVQSEKNKGSIFKIYLPIHPDPKELSYV